MHLRGILLRQAFSPIFPGIPQDAKEGVRFLRVRCILMFRKGRIHHLDTGSYIYTYVGCCLLPPPAKIGKLLIYIYIYICPLKPTQSYVLEGWKTTGAVSVSYIFGKMINYVPRNLFMKRFSIGPFHLVPDISGMAKIVLVLVINLQKHLFQDTSRELA